MRENVVHEYVDEVVETRRRTIQIIEDVHAEITAWHGERFLCDISGWTSVGAAIQEAEKQAKRFKVDKGSTLVLRVSEKKTRRFKEAEGSGGRYNPNAHVRNDEIISFRHVWDSHVGSLDVSIEKADFDLVVPIGIPDGSDPGDGLAHIILGVRGDLSKFQPSLLSGFGLGEYRMASSRRVALTQIPPDERRRPMNWAGLRVQGTLDVLVPGGMPTTKVQEFLEDIKLHPIFDRTMTTKLPSLVLYGCHQDESKVIHYPAAITTAYLPAALA